MVGRSIGDRTGTQRWEVAVTGRFPLRLKEGGVLEKRCGQTGCPWPASKSYQEPGVKAADTALGASQAVQHWIVLGAPGALSRAVTRGTEVATVRGSQKFRAVQGRGGGG